MQTELMLRLIKDEKIVGYLLQVKGRTYLKIMTPGLRGDGVWFPHDGIYDADSFELGIKVKDSNDEWWFEGDIIDVNNNNITTPTLVFNRENYTWMVDCDEWRTQRMKFTLERLREGFCKRIGNIHKHP